ncbi:uncharacterized protein E0L32_003129 [Thyridium curvatum]|uniref:Gfo/Idh/MocA-like oxidoreductase N-terminal domain-containing protein n=1 Tax=Thyridium curvatum TaxID=1093900 RepID=A0A507BDU1_9PEZI|nr:uncharacterized protein E0L32_003129 [Thyridium curvatum]TPX17486.1 hypothetical protein E0L32_003129 [Thyridium curvatum]
MPASTHSSDSDPPAPGAPTSHPAVANGVHAYGADAPATFRPPPPPPMSASPPRFIIIGAGSRGSGYAQAITTSSNGLVAAVAEPHAFKRRQLGRAFIWGDADRAPEGAEFESWRDFVAYERARRGRAAAGERGVPEGVDGAYVCVLDEMHREVVLALAALGGLHIMCEKPLATRLSDCTAMYNALRANRSRPGSGGGEGEGEEEEDGTVFSIGHVMRYSPHNILLRKLLLEDRAVGDILSVEHTEPVGWWHFSHSYVRGNWRREDTSAPSLLTKSCHDIDVLLWLLSSPPSYADRAAVENPHLPSTVASTGSLQFFKRSRKPRGAGAATTNCLSCPVEEACKYSARRVYVGRQLRGLGAGNTGWPVSIVVPEIEDLGREGSPLALERAREMLLDRLGEDYGPETPAAEVAARNWFGRCVFEADNDVCDDQVVTLTWDDDQEAAAAAGEEGADAGPAANGRQASSSSSSSSEPPLLLLDGRVPRGRGAKTAVFHMVAHSRKQCDRYTHIYGTDGDAYADSYTITVNDFRTGATTVHRPRVESLGHGGGDNGLVRQFVLAVDKVKNHGWSAERAQREIVGCTLEEVLRSHALVFCAEDARLGGEVVDWGEWWRRRVVPELKGPGAAEVK